MKRRFALPMAIALTVEAVLMFGFNTPGIVVAEPPRHVVTPDDVRPFDVPQPQDDEAVQGGATHPVPAPPSIPEPPAVPAPDRFPIVVTAQQSQTTLPEVAVIHAPSVPGDDHDGPGPAIIPVTLLDRVPQAKSQPAPIYPREGAGDIRSGEVQVEFNVDRLGRVFSPRIVRSSDPIFEEPTLRAVAKWRFEPGRKDGLAVPFRMTVTVQYSPDGG